VLSDVLDDYKSFVQSFLNAGRASSLEPLRTDESKADYPSAKSRSRLSKGETPSN
jgi:hypothetical protein